MEARHCTVHVEVVERLRALGMREQMIATAVVRELPGCWVVRFTDQVRCPPVVIGADGGHRYFPAALGDEEAACTYLAGR